MTYRLLLYVRSVAEFMDPRLGDKVRDLWIWLLDDSSSRYARKSKNASYMRDASSITILLHTKQITHKRVYFLSFSSFTFYGHFCCEPELKVLPNWQIELCQIIWLKVWNLNCTTFLNFSSKNLVWDLGFMPLLWNISGVKFYYEPPPLEPLSPLNNVLPSPRSSSSQGKYTKKKTIL